METVCPMGSVAIALNFESNNDDHQRSHCGWYAASVGLCSGFKPSLIG
jgi:hypothetical protein